jgi:uncharacterized Zn-finger protein
MKTNCADLKYENKPKDVPKCDNCNKTFSRQDSLKRHKCKNQKTDSNDKIGLVKINNDGDH